MKIVSDNCGSCGLEYLSTELTSVKLGGTIFDNIKICAACQNLENTEKDYFDAVNLIISTSEK